MTRRLLRFNWAIFIALLMYLCFICGLAHGQSSTVTATISDPASQPWANGTITYQIYGIGQYTWQGAPLPASYYSATVVSLDSNGHASFTLPMTSAILPIGSLWKLIVCPASSFNCVTDYIPINGATVDISSAIDALIPLPSIPIQTIPKAYNDNEIQTQISQGGIYYNVGNSPGLRYWTGSAFQSISGSPAGVASINGNTGAFTFTGSVSCTGVPVVCNFTGGTGTVTSVTNSDNTVSITGTAAAPIVSVNLGHSNIWTANQTETDGASNDTVTFGTTPNGVGHTYSYPSGTTPVTGEISYNDLGMQVFVSSAESYFAVDNTYTKGLQFDLNNAKHGADGHPGIYPLTNGYPIVIGGYGGVEIQKIFNTSTSPVDLSNNGNGIKIDLTSASCLGTDANNRIIVGTCPGTITSVSNSDGTITVTNGTAAPVVSLNLAHANTWTAKQTFNGGLQTSFLSANCLGTDASGNVIVGTCSSSGTGNVSTSGTITTNTYALFNGTTTVTSASLGETTTNVTSAKPLQVTGSAQFGGSTGAGPTAATGNCWLWADTSNTWMENCNGGSNYTFATQNSPGTITIGTTAIGANSCATAATLTMTGVTTSSTFDFTPTADTSSVTGWGSTGGLVLVPWPTANTLNYKVCNQTTASITPSASVTFNVTFQNHGVN